MQSDVSHAESEFSVFVSRARAALGALDVHPNHVAVLKLSKDEEGLVEGTVMLEDHTRWPAKRYEADWQGQDATAGQVRTVLDPDLLPNLADGLRRLAAGLGVTPGNRLVIQVVRDKDGSWEIDFTWRCEHLLPFLVEHAAGSAAADQPSAPPT